MKIVVLGATGNVGSRFTKVAAAAGHEVIAYARTPEKVAVVPGVTVAQGAAEDPVALAAVARGADAVLVSITGSTKDATFMQRTLPKILDAATQADVRRIVLVSAFGAGDTVDKASWFARVVYRRVLGKFFADKAAADAVLQNSGFDYTIAYPVNLKDARPLPEVVVKPLADVAHVPGLPTLPFENAAAALLGIVADPETVGQRLLITTPKGWKPAR